MNLGRLGKSDLLVSPSSISRAQTKLAVAVPFTDWAFSSRPLTYFGIY